jgi:hypothetical protein
MYIAHLLKSRIIVLTVVMILVVGSLASVGVASAGSLKCHAWGFLFEAGPSGASAYIQVFNTATFEVVAERHFKLAPNESKTVTVYAAVPSGSYLPLAFMSSGSISATVRDIVDDRYCTTQLPAGEDMVPIPEGAAMGTFNTNTPLYSEPVAGAASPYVIEAGQSLWVFGMDASGAFYQVMLSGQTYWVPVGNIGPTFSPPWDGAPLPTTVVG